jgi:FMN reductase
VLAPVPSDETVPFATVDLADLAPQLFAASRPDVDEALRLVATADVLLVATPVYKASYTGLLKSFLDSYGPDGLAGVAAVPVVVSGNPAHALVGEVHLRPLLVELGATVPARSFTVTEADLADLDPAVDRWIERAAEPLRRSLGGVATLAEVLR